MNSIATLVRAVQVPPAPPAPSADKRVPKDAIHLCHSCRIFFTKKMLAWHLKNDHRVMACKICGARVVAFFSKSRRSVDHFCSDDCWNEAWNRRRTYVDAEIQRINAILRSMEEGHP